MSKFPLFTKFLRIQHDNFATLTSYPNNCYSLDISENSVVKEKGLKGVVVEMDLQNRLKTNIIVEQKYHFIFVDLAKIFLVKNK